MRTQRFQYYLLLFSISFLAWLAFHGDALLIILSNNKDLALLGGLIHYLFPLLMLATASVLGRRTVFLLLFPFSLTLPFIGSALFDWETAKVYQDFSATSLFLAALSFILYASIVPATLKKLAQAKAIGKVNERTPTRDVAQAMTSRFRTAVAAVLPLALIIHTGLDPGLQAKVAEFYPQSVNSAMALMIMCALTMAALAYYLYAIKPLRELGRSRQVNFFMQLEQHKETQAGLGRSILLYGLIGLLLIAVFAIYRLSKS